MDVPENIAKKAEELLRRRRDASNKLRTCATSLEPLLRDLNHHNSADRLAAILGELEALEAEEKEWTQANAPAIAFALLGLPPDFRR